MIERIKIEKKTFSDQQLLTWATQLLIALEALHSNKIIHKDIKPK